MYARIIRALRGKAKWERLERKYNIRDDCAVLVMCERDRVWNGAFLRFAPFFCQKKECKRMIMFVTAETELPEVSENYELVVINDSDVNILLQFYLLIKFSDTIVFCLKDRPNDNKSSYILNNSDVTLDEYVCYGIYKLREVPDV